MRPGGVGLLVTARRVQRGTPGAALLLRAPTGALRALGLRVAAGQLGPGTARRRKPAGRIAGLLVAALAAGLLVAARVAGTLETALVARLLVAAALVVLTVPGLLRLGGLPGGRAAPALPAGLARTRVTEQVRPARVGTRRRVLLTARTAAEGTGEPAALTRRVVPALARNAGALLTGSLLRLTRSAVP